MYWNVGEFACLVQTARMVKSLARNGIKSSKPDDSQSSNLSVMLFWQIRQDRNSCYYLPRDNWRPSLYKGYPWIFLDLRILG